MPRLARGLFLVAAVALLSLHSVAQIPIATRFDYPVSPPDGDGYTMNFGCQWMQTSPRCGPYHPGIDFNSIYGDDYGDPVYASANGVVVFAGRGRWEWGNIILIEHTMPDHRRVWTQYAHLLNMLVEPGQAVWRGEEIGSIGRGAGDVYEPHLHFEVRLEYRPADAWTKGLSRAEISEYYADPRTWIFYTWTIYDSVSIRKPSSLHISKNAEVE